VALWIADAYDVDVGADLIESPPPDLRELQRLISIPSSFFQQVSSCTGEVVAGDPGSTLVKLKEWRVRRRALRPGEPAGNPPSDDAA
jgi:hypothetical protein